VLYVLRYALIVVYTVFWGVVGSLVAPFSGEAVVWVGRHWIGWIFGTCGVRVVVEGLENVDPDGPCILMSNHQSVLDIGALVLTFPGSWRFVAKRELVWIPFFGWVLGLSDQILIERGNRARAVASLDRAAERIRQGARVILFPEGTRSPTGHMRGFKSGGFHLAIQSQVPIQPATVSGSFDLVPKRSLRVRSGTIKVVFGPPIRTEGLEIEDRHRLKERVREAIEQGYDQTMQRASGVAARADLGADPPAA
jgi:1-acyl-sn-glycerol-3-phosphate acyltransferase